MRIVRNAFGSLAVAGLLMVQPASAADPMADRASSPTEDVEQLVMTPMMIFLGILAVVVIAEVSGALDLFSADDATPASP